MCCDSSAEALIRPTPGYVDLQVNGYGGVDFNNDGLTAEELHTACVQLEADDVALCLATVITDEVEVMCGRLERLARLREADVLARRLIAGIHIEGPFINAEDGFRGAHPADAVRPGDVETMERLLEAAVGLTRIVTLAPECDPGEQVTRVLARRGVLIAAGHTDASLDQLRRAIDAGLSMFTHVGNGCPMQLHRHDNIVQRALSLADELWLCFIADGAHVPAPALGNYLRLAGPDRSIVVTDATAAAGAAPGSYTLGRQTVSSAASGAPLSPDGSHFVGSATTMRHSAELLRTVIGLAVADVTKLTSLNGRTALGL